MAQSSKTNEGSQLFISALDLCDVLCLLSLLIPQCREQNEVVTVAKQNTTGRVKIRLHTKYSKLAAMTNGNTQIVKTEVQ